MDATLIHGDCRVELPALRAEQARLVYLDPPFFTQKVHRLGSRDGQHQYAFADLWSGHEQYAAFLHACLSEVWRVLTPDGSVVLHCDRRSSHIARAVLDDVFGAEFFRSEIIWMYRRWSNAQRELLPSHQTLYLYAKGESHVFNPMYGDYSPATNVDQILQRRVRDASGKAIYARDADGAVIAADEKKGVPLGDVWDIPYLNPKARERVGYPTQKPILLLERIVRLLSAPGDLVVDPCCGSGTTLVAARLEGRRALGIDSSAQAIAISRARLAEPVKTESLLLQRGREAYRQLDVAALAALSELGAEDLIPVQRNRGMDAILRQKYRGRPVALRVQRPGETEQHAAALLARAGASKKCELMILIVTGAARSVAAGAALAAAPGTDAVGEPRSARTRAAGSSWPDKVIAVESARYQIAKLLETPAMAASRASSE